MSALHSSSRFTLVPGTVMRDRRGTMEDFLRILKQQDGEVTVFSEKLWCGLLDYATAYADGRLTFTFKNGSTFEG